MEAVARDFAGRADGEIKAELMARPGKPNYIVPKVKDAYEAAFFLEYKKFMGEPMPEDTAGQIQIKVLGPGCPSCDKLE